MKICEIDDVDLLDKRGYLTICISLPREGKVYIRKTEGIREWHRQLKVRCRTFISSTKVAQGVTFQLSSLHKETTFHSIVFLETDTWRAKSLTP